MHETASHQHDGGHPRFPLPQAEGQASAQGKPVHEVILAGIRAAPGKGGALKESRCLPSDRFGRAQGEPHQRRDL